MYEIKKESVINGALNNAFCFPSSFNTPPYPRVNNSHPADPWHVSIILDVLYQCDGTHPVQCYTIQDSRKGSDILQGHVLKVCPPK